MKSEPGDPSGTRQRGRRMHPIDWAARAGTADDVLAELDILLDRRRRVRRRASAAALMMLVVVGLLYLGFSGRYPVRRPAPAESVVVTAAARQVLPDGSAAEYPEGTDISVTFTPAVRLITLRRGEAHFTVVKDIGRPFVVQAGAVQVRAVGTAFAVSMVKASVDVVVTEGRVALDDRSRKAGMPAALSAGPDTLGFVDAGNRAVVTAGEAGEGPRVEAMALTDGELRSRLSWRIARLEFSGATLADVVARFNQYSAVQLVLADAELASIRLSGVVRGDNIDVLVSLLEDQHGVMAQRRGDNMILSKASRRVPARE